MCNNQKQHYERRAADSSLTEGQRRYARNVAHGICEKQKQINHDTPQSYLDRCVKDNKVLIRQKQDMVNAYLVEERKGKKEYKASRENYQDKVAYFKGAQIVLDEESERRKKPKGGLS